MINERELALKIFEFLVKNHNLEDLKYLGRYKKRRAALAKLAFQLAKSYKEEEAFQFPHITDVF